MENHQNPSGISHQTQHSTQKVNQSKVTSGWVFYLQSKLESMVHKYILKSVWTLVPPFLLYPKGKNVPEFGLPAVPVAVFPKPKWW